MVVQSKKGLPKKLKKIEITNLPYACEDGTTGSISSNVGSTPVRYDADSNQSEFTISYQAGPETAIFGFGTVSKDSGKVSGFVEVNFTETTDGITVLCGTSQLGGKAGDFKAKPKKN